MLGVLQFGDCFPFFFFFLDGSDQKLFDVGGRSGRDSEVFDAVFQFGGSSSSVCVRIWLSGWICMWSGFSPALIYACFLDCAVVVESHFPSKTVLLLPRNKPFSGP